jgi:hypothetical protein
MNDRDVRPPSECFDAYDVISYIHRRYRRRRRTQLTLTALGVIAALVLVLTSTAVSTKPTRPEVAVRPTTMTGIAKWELSKASGLSDGEFVTITGPQLPDRQYQWQECGPEVDVEHPAGTGGISCTAPTPLTSGARAQLHEVVAADKGVLCTPSPSDFSSGRRGLTSGPCWVQINDGHANVATLNIVFGTPSATSMGRTPGQSCSKLVTCLYTIKFPGQPFVAGDQVEVELCKPFDSGVYYQQPDCVGLGAINQDYGDKDMSNQCMRSFSEADCSVYIAETRNGTSTRFYWPLTTGTPIPPPK